MTERHDNPTLKPAHWRAKRYDAALVHRSHERRVTDSGTGRPKLSTQSATSAPESDVVISPAEDLAGAFAPKEVARMTDEKTTVHDDDVEREPTLEKLRNLGETVSSSDEDIRGRMVKDRDGRDLGTIDGLLVDAAAGKVRFMEVASGGFLGLGERKSLIPVEAITKITDHEVSITTPSSTWPGHPPTIRAWWQRMRTTSSICTRTTGTRAVSSVLSRRSWAIPPPGATRSLPRWDYHTTPEPA